MKSTRAASVGGIVVAVVLACGGCRTFTSPARHHKLDRGIVWIDYDASRRGTLIMPKGLEGTRVLSEPSPDVAIGVVADLVGKAFYQGISGEASAKVTESVAELGKRTQTIMFLREALFRLNEMQTAREIETADTIALYRLVLETALELAKIDQLKEAQTLDPRVVQAILAPEARVLRQELDALLQRPVKENLVEGREIASMEDYADYLVETIPELEGESLAGIRARGGPKLQRLIDELRKGVKE